MSPTGPLRIETDDGSKTKLSRLSVRFTHLSTIATSPTLNQTNTYAWVDRRYNISVELRVIVAKRDIKKGEEISVYYSSSFIGKEIQAER